MKSRKKYGCCEYAHILETTTVFLCQNTPSNIKNVECTKNITSDKIGT